MYAVAWEKLLTHHTHAWEKFLLSFDFGENIEEITIDPIKRNAPTKHPE